MKIYHLFESRSSIVALGYPEVLAKLFIKKYGKYSYLFAKWYKDYRVYSSHQKDAEWFKYVHKGERKGIDITHLIELYKNTDSTENYLDTKKHFNLYIDPNDYYYDMEEIKENLEKHIEEEFFGHLFFNYFSLINDIKTGKVKDINPYKNLPFDEAQSKYEKNIVFDKTKPIKKYESGYKWIDVGPRCTFVGSAMKNCGSTGVTGTDPDRTILALFDVNNNPHVMVTYQPNEKEIKSDEGKASSEVKPEYHEYILDLAKTLGVSFKSDTSKSKLLKLRYLFKNMPVTVKVVKKDMFDEYFSIQVENDTWYTNGYQAFSKEQVFKFYRAIKTGNIDLAQLLPKLEKPVTLEKLLKLMFSHYNKWKLKELGIDSLEIADLKNKLET